MTKEENQRRANNPKVKELKSRIVNKDMKKPFVFISYKSDDWEIVLTDIVYRLVSRYGLNVYYDGDFDDHADNWINQFPANMESEYCKGVIAFVDNKYATSYATLIELMNSQTLRANIGSVNQGKKDHGLPVVQINLGKLNDSEIDVSSSTFLGERHDDNGNTNTNHRKELEYFNELIDLVTSGGILKGNPIFNQFYGKRLPLTRYNCYMIVSEILEKLELNEKQYTPGDDLDNIYYSIRNAVMRSPDDAENNVFSGKISEDAQPADEPIPASVPVPTPVAVPASVVPEPAPSAVPAKPAPTSGIKPRGLFSGKAPSSPAVPQTSNSDDSSQNSNDSSTIADGTYHLDGNAYSAYCRVENGKYTVLAGSIINSSTTALAAHKWLYQKYADIISGNKLSEDVQFQSSSTAACFIKGNSASGPATFRHLTPLDAGAVPEINRSSEPVPVTDSPADAPTISIRPQGLKAASSPAVPQASEPDDSSQNSNDSSTIADGTYQIKGSAYSAYCRVENGKYTVLAGSLINSSPTDSAAPQWLYQKYADIISGNKLTEDVQFQSSSTAVSFIKGGSKSGPATFRRLTPLDAGAVPETDSQSESDDAATDNDKGIADGIYHITSKNNEYNAYCECMGGSFRVLPGSRIKYATEKYKAGLKGKYDTLTANVRRGVVTESISFTSPSGAACFIVGNSVNGKKLFTEQNLLKGKELAEYLKKHNKN